MDDRDEHKEPRQKVLRGRENCHRKDIICGDYSHNLGLIATGGRDNSVRIWEYEKMILLDEIKNHNSEVTMVHFIKPYPLLVTADSSGVICIWLIKKQREAKTCVVYWVNDFDFSKQCPITAIDSFIDVDMQRIHLLLGDDAGYVRIHDLSAILKEVPECVPIDVS